MSLVARFVIFAGAACLAACSGVTRTPPPEAPKVASQAPAQVTAPPTEVSPPREATPPRESPPPSVAQKAPTPPKSTSVPPASKPPAAPRAAAAPKPPPVASAPKAPATAEAVAPKAPPVAQAPAPKPAPLDLKTLEERLKDTSAIGVLTKLSLKNQVDDLVGQFRAYHDGKRPPTLAELRPGFELLLMKVLSLLQDKDPALAHDVNASRDAIWSVLADKQKFAEFS